MLGDIISNPRNREEDLELMAFVIRSAGKEIILPPNDHKIKAGDQLLFCGTANAKQALKATINNEYTLHYLQTGRYKQSSYFAQWFARRFNKA
ncbi:MAG: hypothetical protein H0A75_07120 [Candidatus Methanofishera endochildressiae]|uniref:RCK C-terminal domain-containing protein n=1 Tax=Candidatus Methanofishera endochildressiae TaxID=2738884 RepID=A0A7Z0MPU2_9GAMM|nr:hypothetical protein [Candidatus Methanofishera endochildressiae]